MNLDKFTEEQKLAITTVDNNVLVSASAGSGKTSVLVTRVCYLIENKYACLNEILVATFTKLASMEMKNRVKSMLEELAKTDSHYLSQLELLSTADISTLHKFCQKLIKEYFYEISVDPNFDILEEAKGKYLLNNLLDELIDEELKNNKDFLPLMMQFNESRNDDCFREIVTKALEFLKSKQNYYEFCARVINQTYSLDINNNLALEFFSEYVDSFLDYYEKKYSNYLLQSQQICFDKLSVVIQEYLNVIKLIKGKDFKTKFLVISSDIEYLSVPRYTKLPAEQIELKDEVRNFSAKFRAKMNAFKEMLVYSTETELVEDINNVKEKMQTFINFVLKLDQRYAEKKQSEKVLDFADLEHYALKILENQKIRENIRNRYKFICVDEYQDTSEIQEKIISYISNGHNLFMVGDMKQSIYGFRECRPEILTNKFKLYQIDNSKGHSIKLNKNFRSEIDILNFSNFVFSNIMQEKAVGLDYKKESSFVFGGNMKSTSEQNVFVTVIDRSEKDTVGPQKMYDKFTAPLIKTELIDLKIQCEYVCKKIKELLNESIYDVKINGFRKIKYKDIAVLSARGSKVSNVLTKVFDENDIPYNAEIKSNIFKVYENAVIFNLLKLICNLDDDIALTSVLTSFLYGVSYDAFAGVLQQGKSVYESLVEYSNQNNDNISEKINKLFCDVKYLKNEFLLKNIVVAFNETLSHYNVIEYLTANKCNDKLSSLMLFVESIKQYSYLSLYEYVRFIQDYMLDDELVSQINSGDDSVSFLTIHGSKGLEFPVTFVINANGLFNQSGKGDCLMLNKDFGFAFDNFDEDNQTKNSGVIKNILKLGNNQMEIAEHMRVMYVALTRAKNKLFVVGSKDLSKTKSLTSSYEIMQANSYLDWIIGSLSQEQIDKLSSSRSLVLDYDDSKFCFNVIDNNIVNETNSHKSYIENMLLDEKNQQYLRQTKPKTNIMLKNTVTEIMNTENETTEYNIKDFVHSTAKNDDNDFLLIGNMYHLVMEKINFNETNSQQDVIDFISQLVTNNLTNIEQIKVVDALKIFKACEFLKSIVGSSDKVIREKTFMLYDNAKNLVNTDNNSKVLVQGVVDLFVIKDDGIVLIDYKTTRAKCESDLINHYETQFHLYAKALEDFYGKKVVQKIIYSFYFDKPIIVDN